MVQFPDVNLKPEIDILEVDIAKTMNNDEVDQWTEQFFSKPFDLSKDSPMRVAFISLDEKKCYLLLNSPHMVSDAWSMDILINEFCQLYEAYYHDLSSSLEKLTIQYYDYSVWQRGWLCGEILSQQLNYWRNQLTDLPSVHSLSLDFPRPVRQQYQGALHEQIITGSHYNGFKSICHKEQASLFMGLHGLFSLLLSRYSNEKDIVIGTAISGRYHKELESLLGCFINNLVLRINLTSSLTFTELLKLCRQTDIAAFNHQYLPFEYLVDEIVRERSLSYSPLFQIMLIMKSNSSTSLSLSDFDVTIEKPQKVAAKYDLTLYATELDDQLLLEWEYNTSLFQKETIIGFSSYFKKILSEVCSNPELLVFEFPLINYQDWLSLTDWQSKNQDIPDTYLHELFEKQVAITPDDLAVESAGISLSYQILNKQADQFAVYLRKHNKADSMLIGLCLNRSVDIAIAYLGVLKAGFAYVPIATDYPRKRIKHILLDAKISTLISNFPFSGALDDSNLNIIRMDEPDTWQIEDSTQNQINNLNRLMTDKFNKTAYVIYTSGSTGKPKGVEISHGALINLLTSMQTEPGIHQKDRFLAVTPIGFDISGLEIFLPLISGASLSIYEHPIAHNIDYLIKTLHDQAITMLQMTPSGWQLLLAAGWQGHSQLTALTGGESLPMDLSETLRIKVKALWNMYGPTETTIWSSLTNISSPRTFNDIGYPIANTELLILDEYYNLVPPQIAGQLYIGGKGLALSYFHNKILTDERFIAHPFMAEERLYQTGDYVRLRHDGKLEYLGRGDQQVKLNGHRVELEEIERMIADIEWIHDVAVILHTDAKRHSKHYLCAYYTADVVIEQNQLKKHLQQSLPDYMIPVFYTQIESFKLTPSGKKDLQSLPQAQLPIENKKMKKIEPQSDMEILLANLVERKLALEFVDIDVNFFEMGADSLDIVKLADDIHKQVKKDIAAVDLFTYPTVKQLADYITENNVGVWHHDRKTSKIKGRQRINKRLTRRRIQDETSIS